MRRLDHALVQVALFVGVASVPGASTAQKKAPVPDTQVQVVARKAAGDVYGSRFKEAKTPAAKSSLAKEMLDTAWRIRDGSADQYVLLETASACLAM